MRAGRPGASPSGACQRLSPERCPCRSPCFSCCSSPVRSSTGGRQAHWNLRARWRSSTSGCRGLSSWFAPLFIQQSGFCSVCEFHWFSTIFGVYNFAGLFFSGLAAIILLALWLERAGPLKGVLNEAHLHDLGKLLFAFSVFWAYIWFSQYMLIWYTDIPEETAYFVRRQHGAWFGFFLANVFINFVIPFFSLLRRDVKRRRQTLAAVAAIVLVGRWLDVYLMIFPGIVGETPTLGLWEIGLTLGGVGAFGLVLAAVLKGAPAVPVADPELVESLEYH
jgi:hypothetical protein